jgi:hypothetical protein
VKVNINDICDVLNNHWPLPEGDWYMEGEAAEVDEELYNTHEGSFAARTPGKIVRLEDLDFTFCWQGPDGEEPAAGPGTFVQHFKRIHLAKTHQTVSYSVPKEKVCALDDFVKKIGGKQV